MRYFFANWPQVVAFLNGQLGVYRLHHCVVGTDIYTPKRFFGIVTEQRVGRITPLDGEISVELF